jgi:hypothetical protein
MMTSNTVQHPRNCWLGAQATDKLTTSDDGTLWFEHDPIKPNRRYHI